MTLEKRLTSIKPNNWESSKYNWLRIRAIKKGIISTRLCTEQWILRNEKSLLTSIFDLCWKSLKNSWMMVMSSRLRSVSNFTMTKGTILYLLIWRCWRLFGLKSTKVKFNLRGMTLKGNSYSRTSGWREQTSGPIYTYKRIIGLTMGLNSTTLG
jgi:hypothetical protein